MPPAPSGSRHTLKDVADRAGVAISTASLVFSGKRHVAAATRARVLQAAEDLDYGGPNPLASSLRQGRSGIVGVFSDGQLRHSFRDPFAVTVLDGLAEHVGQHGAGILLMPSQGESDQAVIKRLSGIPLDAVTFPLGGYVSQAVLDHLRSRRIPLIAAGYPHGEGIIQLHTDDRGAMHAMAQHLADLGHEKVALIELPKARSEGVNTQAAERTAGFRTVFPEATIFTANGTAIEDGFHAAQAILEADDSITAIAAQSDLLAVGAIQYAGATGRSTPGDISITGFDGIALPWLVGTLTTLHQDGHAKGRIIGEMVQQALDGTGSDREHPCLLVVGTSSGPAPSKSTADAEAVHGAVSCD